MRRHLRTVPTTFREALGVIFSRSNHPRPPTSYVFSIGAAREDALVGAIIVCRPSLPHFDDGRTLEVASLGTDDSRNVASFLYGAAWRAAQAMGYDRLIRITTDKAQKSPVTAAGFTLLGVMEPRVAASAETSKRPERRMVWARVE